MTRRNILAALLAVVVAAVCVRLGIWQLQRLGERRARNAAVSARLAAPPVSLNQLPGDPTAARYRRVRLTGTLDFDHEIVLTGRSRQGAPGVHIVTPLRLDGSDRAVLVNRGWVYAPDAATVERSRWFEPERVSLYGYVDVFPLPTAANPRSIGAQRAWRRLDTARIAQTLPYPIEPFYVVVLGTQGEQPRTAPVRLQLPPLDEGPHKNYAIQWFSFATIAIVGVSALIWQDIRKR